MPGVIKMIVSPKVETVITVNGVKGGACQTATASLEARLGTAIAGHVTDEFYEDPHVVEIEQERG